MIKHWDIINALIAQNGGWEISTFWTALAFT